MPVRSSVSEQVILPRPGQVGNLRELLPAEVIAHIRDVTASPLRCLDLLRYLSDVAEAPHRSAAMTGPFCTMQSKLYQSLEHRRNSPARYVEGRFDGRGIVICAGGPRYFICAWVLISVLRNTFRIDLPIQVWHLGQAEMDEEMRFLLEGMNVEVVDAETVVARFPARVAGGWPLKPYAILNSRFREVLYLDADTVPLTDPRAAFEWPLYRESGMLMWPDIIDMKATNPIWRKVGLEPRDCASAEAGILLADKERVWNILDLAVLLNEHVEEIYSDIYGDKDTFLLASLLCSYDLKLIPHRPFIFDVDLVQRDLEGEPFVQHRTGSKWTLRGSNRPLANAALMPACESALAALREGWSGSIFNPPLRSRSARLEQERLIAVRRFRYEPEGSDSRGLELLPANRVGDGRGEFEQHWAVVERGGTLILQFYSATRLMIELTRGADGAWQGHGIAPFAFNAKLIEESAYKTWPHADGRVRNSAAEWVQMLLATDLFAAGFDAERATELRAALILLNEHYDDVAEQVSAKTGSIAIPESWQQMLTTVCKELASRRDKRISLVARAEYPAVIDPSCYEKQM